MASDPRRLPTRRSVVRLLGGVAGAGLWPVNFAGCGFPGGPVSVGSGFVPTPDEPLTPPDRFYINTNFYTPETPPPRQYRLHVQGMVDAPLSLSLDDLADLPQETRELTLECIGNSPGGSLISSQAFTGVALADVLAAAGASDRARGLQMLGLDGYPAYLPIDVDALLVTELGGLPLTADHGAPLRALIPGRYGMFSVKWLDSITLTREYATYGSLGQLLNFLDGESRVRSRIDSVFGQQRVTVGEPIVLSGLAVTPGTGVRRVQVDTGGGWADAELSFDPLSEGRSPWLWSLWRTEWTPQTPGEHVLRVRAIDTDGNTQDAQADFPYDSSAIHRVVVVAVDGDR